MNTRIGDTSDQSGVSRSGRAGTPGPRATIGPALSSIEQVECAQESRANCSVSRQMRSYPRQLAPIRHGSKGCDGRRACLCKLSSAPRRHRVGLPSYVTIQW